ncbi:ScyD/ScyE family protein [Flavihumibacter sp. R14]|nr:ScyD/ScyE family protein [Flavihumibacter soli]
MKKLFVFFFLVFIAMVIPGCEREQLAEKSVDDQGNAIKAVESGEPEQLVTGIDGTVIGSTIGPGGDLFVPSSAAGAILRIDPETGNYTTFASGLPQEMPGFEFGGITDLAFIGSTAYALVSAVDDPNFFPTGQVNGIYRIDGPNSYTIIADIGAYNIANPPTGFNVDVVTGILYSIQPYQGGFLVTDGHLNRVLHVTLDGEITVARQFNNIVPTGMAVRGNQVFLSQAGPVPHLPENGKVVSFDLKSPSVITVASGAPLVVDVEFGRGQTLFALSQGDYSGNPEGSPALPNTGSLVRVNADGTFSVIADGLDRPTSLEIIGNTAYIVTIAGEIWTIDNIAGPPYGKAH